MRIAAALLWKIKRRARHPPAPSHPACVQILRHILPRRIHALAADVREDFLQRPLPDTLSDAGSSSSMRMPLSFVPAEERMNACTMSIRRVSSFVACRKE
ncbi:MAG: hypothetical protein IPK15_27320 [Verrucomicrobia bacterium]|nr:hypothetical protein [Verrucomicrobiota bacterium]